MVGGSKVIVKILRIVALVIFGGSNIIAKICGGLRALEKFLVDLRPLRIFLADLRRL